MAQLAQRFGHEMPNNGWRIQGTGQATEEGTVSPAVDQLPENFHQPLHRLGVPLVRSHSRVCGGGSCHCHFLEKLPLQIPIRRQQRFHKCLSSSCSGRGQDPPDRMRERCLNCVDWATDLCCKAIKCDHRTDDKDHPRRQDEAVLQRKEVEVLCQLTEAPPSSIVLERRGLSRRIKVPNKHAYELRLVDVLPLPGLQTGDGFLCFAVYPNRRVVGDHF
mmetsp:Transcript_96819/g.166943  ORF Transcript_96819/g.166943 Transcript_96819/m.166943 type:complete len:218 (-) Transcript_96819:1810-2463(-)